AQVVAEALGVSIDRIRITKTTTEKVPNTSATAASSGSDLNGMAALDACRQLIERLTAFASEAKGVPPELVSIGETVQIGQEEMPFEDFIKTAYLARIQLSAAG